MANGVKQIRKTSNTKGVSHYTFWLLKEDTAAGTVYGDAYQFPGLVNVTLTDSGGVAVDDADNGAYEAVAYTEKIGHDIENVDIPPEVDAMWRGAEPDKFGGFTYGKDNKQAYFAAAWRLDKVEGWHRYFRSYKGAYTLASNAGGKTAPSSGAPEFQHAKASYTALNRDFDGAVYYLLDDRDMTDEQKAKMEENWFTDPNWFPDWITDEAENTQGE